MPFPTLSAASAVPLYFAAQDGSSLEIVWILLALLFGVFVGWLVWGKHFGGQLKSQLTGLGNERDALANQLRNETAVARQTQLDLSSQITAKEEKVSQLQLQLSRVEQDAARSQERAQQLDITTKEQAQDIQELEAVQTQLRRELEVTAEVRAQLQEELTQANDSRAATEGKMATVQQDNEILKLDLVQLRAVSEATEARLTGEMKSQHESARIAALATQKKLATAEVELAEAQKAESTARESLDKVNADYRNVYAQWEASKAALASEQASLAELREAKASVDTTLQAKSTELADTLVKLTAAQELAALPPLRLDATEAEKMVVELRKSTLQAQQARLAVEQENNTLNDKFTQLELNFRQVTQDKEAAAERESALQAELAELTQAKELAANLQQQHGELAGKLQAAAEELQFTKAAPEEYKKLITSHGNLTAEHNRAKSSIAELEKQVAHLRGETDTAKRTTQAAQSKVAEQDSAYKKLEMNFQGVQADLNKAKKAAADAQGIITTLRSDVDLARKATTEAQARLATLDADRKKLELSLAASQAEQQKAKAAEVEAVKLAASVRQELEVAKRATTDVSAKQSQLESGYKKIELELSGTKADQHKAKVAEGEAEKLVGALRGELEAAKKAQVDALARLAAQETEFKKLDLSYTGLVAEHGRAKATAEAAEKLAASLRGELETAKRGHVDARGQIVEQDSEKRKLQLNINNLQADHGKAVAATDDSAKLVQLLRAELEDAKRGLVEANQSLAERHTEQQRLQSSLVAATAEQGKAKAVAEEAAKALQLVRQDLENSRRSALDFRTKGEQLESELNKLRLAANQALAESKKSTAAAEDNAKQLAAVRHDQAGLKKNLTEALSQVTKETASRAEAERLLVIARADFEKARVAEKEVTARYQALLAERNANRKTSIPSAALVTPSFLEHKQAVQLPLFDETPQQDPVFGEIYTTAPAHPDDLGLINGVGDTLVKQLHSAGIYTFRQIAQWSDAQVAAFQAKIGFKDRIGRERWIAQAKRLATLKDAGAVLTELTQAELAELP
jgi:predicted flap endonuclease-1-like 5' DNA nuclease/chromosome segregation ATPase